MPAPLATPLPHAYAAGQRFRELRKARGWSLMDVQEQSELRFGPEGRVKYEQLSRIERGKYDRIYLADIVHLGALYGMNPNQVAELFGLYHDPNPDDMPDEVRAILGTLPTLPPVLRDALLLTLRIAVMQAEQQANEWKLSQSDNRRKSE